MLVCLFGFLTSSSTTRLYRGRVPRLKSDNFMCCHPLGKAETRKKRKNITQKRKEEIKKKKRENIDKEEELLCPIHETKAATSNYFIVQPIATYQENFHVPGTRRGCLVP